MRFPIFLALCAAVAAAQTGPVTTFTLQDVRVIDGTGAAPIEHATIVIQNGKVARLGTGRIAPAGTILKLSGKTVMPGLINAHGHVGLVKGNSVSPGNYTGLNIMHQLVQYERYGVTTIMSLGLNRDLLYQLRKEQGRGNEPGATVLTAGRGIGAPNGAPALNVGKDQVYRPHSAEEARQAVRTMAAQSPNLIKLWVDDNFGKLPKLAPDIYSAVIDEAHRNNLKVAAHVFYLADARQLVNDGVDILAHSVRDQPIDAATLSQMKTRGTYYIPTLQLEEAFYVFGEKPSWLEQPFFQHAVTPQLTKFLTAQDEKAAAPHRTAFATALTNVKRAHDETVALAFGTDSGANASRIPGWAEHRELQLLVQAGLTPLEAIHSATGVNAQMLGLAERTGTLAAGKQADLLVLNANPLTDIANTQQIAIIFHNGHRVTLSDKP